MTINFTITGIKINTKCERRHQVRDLHVRRNYGACGAKEDHIAFPQRFHKKVRTMLSSTFDTNATAYP